jgi:signal transduction histidine kinase
MPPVRLPGGAAPEQVCVDQPEALARMARAADRIVYLLAGTAFVLAAVVLGPRPLELVPLAVAALPWLLAGAGQVLPPALFALATLAPVAALVSVADNDKPVLLVIVVLATWVALRSDSWPLITAVVAAGCVFSVVSFARGAPPEYGNYLASGSVVWIPACVFGAAAGYALRRAGVLAAELASAQAQLVAGVAARDRQAVAQDVHDIVAHSLGVMLLNITGARKALRGNPDRADTALAQAEAVGRESLHSIRGVVDLLRDTPPAPSTAPAQHRPGSDRPGSAVRSGPLLTAGDLPELVAGYRRGGLPADLRINGAIEQVDAVAGSVLYRTVRESLANVLHHAGPVPTTVDVTVSRAEIEVRVTNPIIASAPAPARRGLGLDGITERVATVGGAVTAGPVGSSWQVAVTIPLAEPASRILTPPAPLDGHA